MAPVEFRILGTIAVERGGRAVPLSGTRQRALLALLLLRANEAVLTDELIIELWGPDAPSAARKRLHMAVARLRASLEDGDDARGAPALLQSVPRGYKLVVERDRIDAGRFERLLDEGRRALDAEGPDRAAHLLREALALWRGPALSDVSLNGVAHAECARLEELRMTALESRLDADLQLGRHAAVVGELEALVRRHPTRERLLGQLMLALYRCGRQEEALDVFHRARARLSADLGLEPGPALRTLQRRILVQDPSLEPSPRPSGDDERGDPPSAARRRRRPALIVTAVAGLLAGLVVAVWLLVDGRGSDGSDPARPGLAVVDTADGEVVERVALSGRPEGLTTFAGSVWLADGAAGRVNRIDAEDLRVVDTIDVGGEIAAIASGFGAVWALSGSESTVAQINPRSNTVVRRVRVGNGARALTVGSGAVWVANGLDSEVSRIDPGRGVTAATIPVGATPAGVAAGPGAVWVANSGDGTVTRIDPVRNVPVRTVRVGSGPSSIAASETAAWVANGSDGTVSRIDARDSTVTATARVPGARNVTLSDGAVWVGDDDGTLTRLDGATGAIEERIAIGGAVNGVHGDGRRIWLAAGAPGGGRRGGTLTVRGPGDGRIDPAVADDYVEFAMLAATHDGLVTFRRVTGAGGVEVVADLASTVPQAVDGGLTYHFQLRPGIRYSSGAAVRARDVRASIERLHRMGSEWLTEVPLALRGESRCGRRACDLSEAIEVDDAANSVTFRLARPNPNFLVNLASPIYGLVPSGTPAREVSDGPPGTGPYRVRGVPSKRGLVLERNPRFREWSAEAQPDGFADRIVWRFWDDDELSSGGDGEDVVLFAPRAQLRRLAVAEPDRVRMRPLPVVVFMWLNTRAAPFDDPDARRALALATDRVELARVGIEGGGVQPICQLLTPNVGGYEPYCPFTLRPGSASPVAPPDLDAARRLVERSGTAGTSVAVHVPSDLASARAIGRWYVQLLRRIGYRARLAVRDVATYFPRTAAPRHRAQMGWANWAATAPLGSYVVPPLVGCPRSTPGFSFNPARFCSGRLDAMMRRATDLQQSDPAASAALWARIDREVVRSAALIPLFAVREAAITSVRVVEYQVHEALGPLFAQIPLRCAGRRDC